MFKLLSFIFFVLILIPIWFGRILFGTSRFNKRFHKSQSTWDQPVSLQESIAQVDIHQPIK